ncbi:MAG TPA: hypothetical protein VFX98_13705 [Longimicrobiaceae bacterium]|nr:hypothetical protein [Longimicrobiaceae bacterium]
MSATPRSPTEPPGGCGLRGCLYGTVLVFGVLLAILLGYVLLRVWQVPAFLR